MAEEEKDDAKQGSKGGLLENKAILLGAIVVAQAVLAIVVTQFMIVPNLGVRQAMVPGQEMGMIEIDETIPEIGIIVSLEEIIVTLQSDNPEIPSYLRINVALEVEDQATADLALARLPQLRDLVIMTLCLNDFSLGADGGVKQRLQRRNPREYSAMSALLGTLIRHSRLAFVVHHRVRGSRLDDEQWNRWYTKHILRGKSTVRAGFELLSELQAEHGFESAVVILPDFRNPFSAYRSGDLHQEVFREASGLGNLDVIDIGKGFARIDDDAMRFSHDGCHLNEFGHEVMAKILLQVVADRYKGR